MIRRFTSEERRKTKKLSAKLRRLSANRDTNEVGHLPEPIEDVTQMPEANKRHEFAGLNCSSSCEIDNNC